MTMMLPGAWRCERHHLWTNSDCPDCDDELMAAADAKCDHAWISVSGTNDYECRACGAVKHDNGEVTGEW